MAAPSIGGEASWTEIMLSFVTQRAEMDGFRDFGALNHHRQWFSFTGLGLIGQFPADLFKDVSAWGAQQTLIADLVETSGKDMLDVATDELQMPQASWSSTDTP